jgi:hypothetical protein
LLSTIVATAIAAPLAYLSLGYFLESIILYFGDIAYAGIKSGFNFLLTFLNIGILLLSVFLGSLKMLNRFLNKDVVQLMSEVR